MFVYNSLTHAVGFDYETYCEIIPSRTLSPKCFTAQYDFAVSNSCSYEKKHAASLGTAGWAHLSTRHHIKPSPKARA